MPESSTGEFRHEGFTLSYELHGPPGGTPLLLLHGILLDNAVNRELAETFAGEGFRVILLDLLGHGKSDKTRFAGDLRVDFFGEQAVALLDHLKIERAIVGGVSLGAITALHVAVQAPERVRALLLEMPVMEQSTPFAALMLVPLMLAVHYAAPVYRPVARWLRGLPRPRKAVWESVLNAASQDPETIKAILHGVFVGPVVPPRRARRRIKAPTLIVGHDGDWLHNLEDAQELAEEIPGAQMITAHSILELRTRPGRLMPEILEFLHRCAGTRSASVPAEEPAAVRANGNGHDSAPGGGLLAQFEAAVHTVRSAPANGPFKPSNEMKLRMYALYRQAKDGDVHGKRPGITDPVGRFKYDAWAALKGLASEEAMRRYIAEVDTIAQRAG